MPFQGTHNDTVQFSSAAYTVNESGPSAAITLSRIGTGVGPASVRIATSNGSATAGSDYTAVSQTVTWTNGDIANKSVSVLISNDAVDEPNETVNLALSAASGASLGSPGTAVLTILDNDEPGAAPSISVTDVAGAEGNEGATTFRFMVRLSAAASGPVSVRYQTADGSAVAGSDYNALGGTVNFVAGETTKVVSIAVRGDRTVEPDETFLLNLSNPVGATIADGSGIGTISNDDAPPALPSLRINDVSVTEGRARTTKIATFTVSLSAASSQTVTVNFATANGTAVAPGDYTPRSGTLSFAPGVTSRTLGVTVKGDSTREPNETYRVNLSGPANATIADGQGIGTIRNDD
ncbi:MAG: Calx-beta domain-containing protein [Panacagrimonas sp.]